MLRWMLCAIALVSPSIINTSLGQEPLLSDLMSRVAASKAQWPEGSLDCSVESMYGDFEVRCWWAGDAIRRQYHEIGKEQERWHIVSRSKVLLYDSNTHVAAIFDRSSRPDPDPMVRVLPNETWFELLSRNDITKWMRKVHDDSRFGLKKTNNGFVAEFDEGDKKLLVDFSSEGMLLSFKSTTSNQDRSTIEGSFEWDDAGDTPIPKRFRRARRKSQREPWQTDVACNIKEFKTTLPADHPSLSIPPDDIPFGTFVVDHTKRAGKSSETSSYVGGDEGRLQFQLYQSARSLKEKE